MKNILITGGAGFIGSHLCDYLLKDNNIICLDNLITGSFENIRHISQHPHFQFIECDCTSAGKVLDALWDMQIDEIYHLASIASPKFYVDYPLETIKVNTIGTEVLLEIARKRNSKLLYTSTSEVYGDPLEHPQREEYTGNVNCIGQRAVYDESKRLGETLLSAYVRSFNVDAKIVRLFNTFGPRLAIGDGRIIPAFINQALRNESITVFGSGTQTRSFCYVDDTVQALVKMMNSKHLGPINIGNPYEYYSVQEVAEVIIELMHTQSKIIYTDFLTADDPKVRQPDISKAKRLLQWQPIIAFDEGLLKTIEYFKSKI